MASLNLNKVILAGHLAETPELKQTTGTNPVSVCKVRLIINRPKKQDGSPGGMDGFDVIAWRGAAEFVSRYFRKGQAMCVTGKLQNRSYKDKNNETRWVTEIVADEINFVDSANNNQQNAPVAPQNDAGGTRQAPPTNSTPQAQTPQSAQQNAQTYAPQFYPSPDDDLPF